MAENLKEKFAVIKELTDLFKFERMVYLIITILSFCMLFGSALSLMINGNAGVVELSMLFGSSGLISYTAGRSIYMWHESLKRLMHTEEENT